MSFEKYDGTALDTSVFETIDVQPEPEVAPQTEVVETVESKPEVVETTTPPSTEPTDKIVVDGIGELTIDEIKELKQAGLRQADYTKKTQELARQREELKQAADLFQYLQANPQLIEALKQAENNPNPGIFNTATPEAEMIRQLAYNQKAMEVDMKLEKLKEKYGDVDEVALFTKATELRTDDLEFVYKALKYDADKVDKQALIEEAKRQLKAELEAERTSVHTTVVERPTSNIAPQRTLTADEKRIAAAMGMSENDYLKWSQ